MELDTLIVIGHQLDVVNDVGQQMGPFHHGAPILAFDVSKVDVQMVERRLIVDEHTQLVAWDGVARRHSLTSILQNGLEQRQMSLIEITKGAQIAANHQGVEIEFHLLLGRQGSIVRTLPFQIFAKQKTVDRVKILVDDAVSLGAVKKVK